MAFSHQEVESYIEHIQSLFEEKVSRVQFDNRALRRELEQRGGTSEGQVTHIRRLLQQHCGLGGTPTSTASTAITGTTNTNSSCHNGSASANDMGAIGATTGQALHHHDNSPNAILNNTATLNDQMTLVEQVRAENFYDCIWVEQGVQQQVLCDSNIISRFAAAYI